MKKILILSHTRAFSDFKIGSHHYANKLADLGFQVSYSGVPETIFHKLLKKEIRGPYKLDANVKNTQLRTLFPITLPSSIFTETLNCRLLPFYKGNSKILDEYYDVIICDYPYFYPLIKHLKYFSLIYRPTDDYLAMGGDKVRAYESRICIEATKIVPTSEVVSNVIINRYSISKNRIETITNGFDADKFFIKNNSKDRKGAVYIGSLDDRFDFDALKILAQKNKQEIFDIFGPINKSAQQRVDELKSFNNIKFHGSVNYDDTNNVLNNYKVGLLLLKNDPSNKGRSPMKLWEYIACGLNVLYSNIDNIAHVKNTYQYSNGSDILVVFNKAIDTPCSILDTHDSLKINSWEHKVKLLTDFFPE
ncbi:glycosyltransferase [Escherichia coli O9,9a:H4]